jgi:DNA-binding NtrC family response regulator
MSASRFIVCAKTPTWAVAIRRQWLVSGPRICETRSLELCWQDLEQFPKSLVVAELTDNNLGALARWLRRVARRFPDTRVVVVGEHRMEACQWLLREMGAVHAIFSPRNLEDLVRIARRHLENGPVTITTGDDRWARDAVGTLLPWRLSL